MAGVLFFMPAFLLLSVLAVYLAWGDVPLVQGLFYGIKPAVVAIVLFAAWRIGSKALKSKRLVEYAAAAHCHFCVWNRFSLDCVGSRVVGRDWWRDLCQTSLKAAAGMAHLTSNTAQQ